MKKTPVLAVVGATASGKSALAMTIAKTLPGEIVCMDSMQVYRGMDIGTAKPAKAEQAEVPHHLLDIVDPQESFSVADYAGLAEPILYEIAARGKLPILVGGTGLYLRTLMQGMPLGGAKSDEAVRTRLWERAEQPDGKEALHQSLAEVDPTAAAKLHPNDLRRVIRALEIYEVTGIPMSRQNDVAPERPFEFCVIGTQMERDTLYQRINCRVDAMMQNGLLQEVAALLEAGVSPDAQAMQGIGYKELAPVAEGVVDLADAADLLKRNTRHYAKRQLTWFKGEPSVRWVDMKTEGAQAEAMTIAQAFWQGMEEGRQG